MPRLAPVDAEMWFKLGHQQTSAKRPELAIACYETAMKADPTKVDIHLNLGVIHARRRDYHNALKYFRSALELATEGRERVHGNLGFVLMKLDRRDEAIAEYGKSLAIDPRQPRIRHKVVGLLDEEGRFAESIRILSEGLELNPGNLVLSADLARLLATAPDADLRDGERAVRLAETVCSNVRPPNARYLDTLAAAYAETGDFKRAVAAAERAATLARSQDNPGLARAIEGRRRLYRMRKPYHFRPVSTGPR